MIKKSYLFILCLGFLNSLIFLPSAAQTELTYKEHMTKAGEAFGAEDWAALNTHLDAAQAIRPYSLYVWKNRILARQLIGDTEAALALTQTIADRGLAMEISGHAALDALAAKDEFTTIAAKMEQNKTPKGSPDVMYESANSGLLPEAYAVDGKTTYVGSVRTGQIMRAEKDGPLEGIAFAQGGVFDIEVRGKTLWAAVNNQLAYENADPENKFASLMQFDLKSGAPRREVGVGDEDAIIGDIEVSKNSDVYASDSITPRIFKLEKDGDEAAVLSNDSRFVNLQGIALDEKNNRLFIADYLAGLFVADIDTGDVTAIANTADAHLGGIDGLYLYKGELIGIQNGTTPRRIVRIGLSEDASEAISLTVLAQNLENWNEPTHGVVVKDRFDYIATSNWPSYDADWNVREGAELQPLQIMSVELD